MLTRPKVLALGATGLAALLVFQGTATGATTTDYLTPREPAPGEREAELNVEGTPFTGTEDGKVRGFIDAHTHMLASEGFGGSIICGDAFSPLGADVALEDCESHGTDGSTAILENLLNSANTEGPFAKHDTQAWPTFNDFPTSTSMTHQSMYYRWVERSWRGGQRVLVMHAVHNNVFCSLPLQKNKYSCDDMDAVNRQVTAARNLEEYVDSQYGDPSEDLGWFRIVESSEQAREVIADGKLAVVLAVETSRPFGCQLVWGAPGCTKEDIDQGLDQLYDAGVRSMFLCHKFDNALCGVRFDEGDQGIAVNAGNFLTNGVFWDAETCTGELHDNTLAGDVIPKEHAPYLPVTRALPIYPEGPHCNTRGLTDLGHYALQGMMERGMMVELDHMSVKAVQDTLDVVERAGYPGIISSHSWMDPQLNERVYAAGGYITDYGLDSPDMVEQFDRFKALRAQYNKAPGFGIDSNGFGSQPGPVASEWPESARVDYPFEGVADSGTFDRQTTGERSFDINEDGLAHYGLMPDYLQQLRQLGGDDVIDELLGGAESYLQTFSAMENYVGPARTNIAAGKPATASSVQWFGDFGAANITDASVETRWSSMREGLDNSPWVQVDLGEVTSIDSVTLHWERALASAYRVQVSTDGRTWTDVAIETHGDGDHDRHDFDAIDARYVRVACDEYGSAWVNYSLYDLAVYAAQ